MASKPESIAKLIDHTLLKAETDREGIERLCGEAVAEGFCSVCVNPFWVKMVADLLKEETVKVCTVIGFPLGADNPRVKAYQAGSAMEQGARELDMVVNIGAVKSGYYRTVEEEIREVRKAAEDNIIKVIIETCFLNREEKVRLCEIVRECGADFVKTSTGFGSAGASLDDVRLLRETVGPNVGVKASGGIRDLETLIGMVKAGANRIGTSSGVRIMEEYRQKNKEEEL
ncbi:MAG: deoxyribose-phosphate aldolase [Bacillota bacterium]|nr:deoxyribose-phosphate aldolase [Bacillota bacterium]MDD3297532.1 deoxyribose-phosphate aldolase [Bacillota bacterium]MDD3850220.1 deoxyribose-phosphate aldolase [Bacillota bacterium]MDD4707237.1 deoxyribose-phosphate aldolase [Bacillota bacterium]